MSGLAFLCVHVVHECLEFSRFFFGDFRLVIIFLVIFKQHREHVSNGLAFGVAHRIDGSIGTFSHQLVLQPVSLAVAANDAPDLPEADVVQELVAADADLANDELVQVVGG